MASSGMPDWLEPSREIFERVSRALDNLQAEGRTDYDQALKKALALRPDVLFFLTDASDLPPRLIVETTRVNAGRTAIHVIELAGRHDAHGSDLQFLARENRGVLRQCSPLTRISHPGARLRRASGIRLRVKPPWLPRPGAG